MPVTAPPRGVGSSLVNRQARPLNGLEVKEAVEKHVLSMTNKLLSNVGLLSDSVVDLVDKVQSTAREVLDRQTRLQKIHVTYPKVGWSIKIRLEESENLRWISGEIELDLERNVRLNIRFGPSPDVGVVVGSLEEEKIPTAVPDKDRQSFGLPVEAEYIKPDGTVGKVNINELKGEKRAARTVDVGRARVEGKEVTIGAPVVLPSELPEITLDDIIATPPPEPPKEPLKEPLPPPKSMAGVKRPDVKFKGGR